MPLNAGVLNRRITIKRLPVDSLDSFGQPNEAWEAVVTVWAMFRAPNGMGVLRAERQQAGGEVQTSSCSWRVRYRADITPSMRAEETVAGVTTIWDIKQVLPDRAGREFIDLVCETGANEG